MTKISARHSLALAASLLLASSSLAEDIKSLAFRDAVDAPPAGWTGPVFKLSHDYPKSKPKCEAPWLKRKVSFTDKKATWNEWQAYIQDIVDYVWQGQNPDLPDQEGWKTAVGSETRWFHIPWMAYDGERGREFAHGLTNELSTAESTFREGGRGSGKHHLMGAKPEADGTDPLFETWSVGMYNDCGAWSVGQSFPSSGAPATHTDKQGRNFANGLPFEPGTVVIKILNTTATADQVPYLARSTDWSADGHKQLSPTKYAACQREPRKVHLVQMDIAVIDPRSPTRWVYSTLVYDGHKEGASVRDRLEPLGVQWGNDPGSFPAVPQDKSKPIWQTIHAPVGVPEHLGCDKRLAGVVDQADSSCVSCHMGAFAAPAGTVGIQGKTIPAIFTFPGMCTTHNAGNKDYFSNYRYPATYPSGQFKSAIPLDSSLQLQVAFSEYATALNPPVNPTCPPAN